MMVNRFHSRRAIGLIAMLLCLTFVLSGCKLITTDPTVAAKAVVAEAGGASITRGELDGPYIMTLSQYASLYQAYGISVDTTDETFISSVKQSTLSTLTNQKVREQQFAARGLSLTAEDEAQAQTNADSDYESWLSSYTSSLQSSNASLSDAQAREQAVTLMDSQGITRELLLGMGRDTIIAEKLKEDVTRDVAISAADVEAEAITRRDAQKEKYTATPSSFGSDMTGSTVILYRPAGYRYVKNLLIGIPAEIQTELDALDEQLYTNSYNRYSLEQQKASYGADINAATEETFTELFASLDEEAAQIQQKMEEKRREGKEQVKAKAEEVLAAAKSDPANIDALIASDGTDPGMTEEPYKSNGYPVSADSTDYVAEFRDAAMALAQPGDISELVETDYGYHILQYASDIPDGDVPTSEVAESLGKELLESRRDELYNNAFSEWVTAANVKTYMDRWK